ncbi:MAG TPA: hypothetical protein VK430_00855 [Xanthobacteraceae bacterium]|nr:hypothetical protein [Xanthobacteraceae bacterium]
MANIRTVAAATAFFVGLPLLVVPLDRTAAQTVADPAPGKPIPLLQFRAPPDKAEATPHGKKMSRTAGKARSVVAKRNATRLAKTATAEAAARAWPTPAAPLQTNLAAVEAAEQIASSADAPVSSELVIGGHTVQIVSADAANEIDLAADTPTAAATTVPPSDLADAASAAEPVLERPAVAPARPASSAFDSSSWIAQMLAALGGALAAGSVAWFLIGSAPQRTYG